MARKSAVLTAEGKKEALAQLSNTVADAKGVLKQAVARQKEINTTKATVVRAYEKAQKQHSRDLQAIDKELAKASKEIARAEAKVEIAVKSLAELKATVVTKPPKVTITKTGRTHGAPATVQSALSQPLVQPAPTTQQ